MMRQLRIGLTDMALHTSFVPPEPAAAAAAASPGGVSRVFVEAGQKPDSIFDVERRVVAGTDVSMWWSSTAQQVGPLLHFWPVESINISSGS